jgi:hypothetical protein
VIAGQDVWISAARTLQRLRTGAGPQPSPPDVRALLQRISEDDFLFLRHNPPLLYHNDLTASVSRYYWSEDFGYALWLRLCFEMNEHPAGGAK